MLKVNILNILDTSSNNNKKIFAFVSLIIIQISLLLIITLSKDKQIYYTYNPASAICMAEFIKLVLCTIGYLYSSSNRKFIEIIDIFCKRKDAVIIYSILALIYCINNQITFISLALTTPGTVALIKSITPFLTAALQYIFYKNKVINLEWIVITLVCCGLIITQWNVCTSSLNLPFNALIVLLFSCTLTAISSVGNSWVLKTSKVSNISIMLQNILLYFFGIIFNFMTYHMGLFEKYFDYTSRDTKRHFFDGYDNCFAISVVFLNGFIGVAITFVYKYGDAIIKCFAQVLSSIILVIISALFFGTKFNIVTLCGTIVVFSSSYIYLVIIPNFKENFINNTK